MSNQTVLSLFVLLIILIESEKSAIAEYISTYCKQADFADISPLFADRVKENPARNICTCVLTRIFPPGDSQRK